MPAHAVIPPAHLAVPRLDLRDLPPPAPMLRALEAADALAPGEAVQVLTPLMPAPLLQALEERGMQVTADALPEGGALVLIRRPAGDGTPGA